MYINNHMNVYCVETKIRVNLLGQIFPLNHNNIFAESSQVFQHALGPGLQ